MLEENRFLAMKSLARDIRKQNEKRFQDFENESVDEAIKEKNEFVESIMDNIRVAFSDGDKGKEEKQIFRANLLIPDDIAFFQAYSKDKNIRNLMNKYAVSIEDIMGKITELNLYSDYIETFNTREENQDEFVNDMVDLSSEEASVNLSSKEAENLLNEIEDLSSAMEELDIRTNDEKEANDSISLEPETISQPKVIEQLETTTEPIISNIEDDKDAFSFDFESVSTSLEKGSKDEDIEITDEIENIGSAVSEFVDEYTKVKKELEFTQAKAEKFSSEKEELRKHLTSLKEDKNVLEKHNAQLREELEKTKGELKKSLADNKQLKEKVEVMEKTAKQSTDLLKEIYKSIPKKRFNVK